MLAVDHYAIDTDMYMLLDRSADRYSYNVPRELYLSSHYAEDVEMDSGWCKVPSNAEDE